MSMQTVIVYIIVAFAAMGAGIYFFKRLRGMRKKKECGSCTGCPLKGQCSDAVGGNVPPEGGGCGC